MLPRRRSVQLLLVLVTKSQGNTKLLFVDDLHFSSILVQVLGGCGDFSTQVDP